MLDFDTLRACGADESARSHFQILSTKFRWKNTSGNLSLYTLQFTNLNNKCLDGRSIGCHVV